MTRLPETFSYLGKPLHAPGGREAETVRAEQRAAIAAADSPETRVKAAAALRAAGEFREALRVLTIGLRNSPGHAELLTSRGHTYVNARSPKKAAEDLEKAVKVAPGSFGAWYHLALARWFLQDFGAAAETFKQAADATHSDSSKLAANTWQYSALLRAGKEDAAAALLPNINWDVDLEGRNYNYQLRARFYQGSLREEDLTASLEKLPTSQGSLGFGIGIWHLVRGNDDLARKHFETAAASETWAAFGTAAAELELALLDGTEPVLPETHSVLGEPLHTIGAVDPAKLPELRETEEKARQALKENPDDVAAMHAYARATGSGLMQYRETIRFLDDCISRHADEPLLLCDRGHYKLNIREFEAAEKDLLAAADLDQDTFDIWYHLGLAHWFRANYGEALTNFKKALDTTDPATLQGESHTVAVSDWIYLTLSRLGRHEEAQEAIAGIHADMKTTGNNHLYLKRLLFYKGELTEAELIEIFDQGGLALASYFGLGCWHTVHGDMETAIRYFEKVVDQGTVWAGWAHGAAELELYRHL